MSDDFVGASSASASVDDARMELQLVKAMYPLKQLGIWRERMFQCQESFWIK